MSDTQAAIYIAGLAALLEESNLVAASALYGIAGAVQIGALHPEVLQDMAEAIGDLSVKAVDRIEQAQINAERARMN